VKPIILLLGKNGQVGSELRRLLPQVGEVAACDRHDLDLCKPNSIRQVLQQVRPLLIVNAAAYTAVDRAETDRAAAQAVNADAPAVLAEEAQKLGAGLIHFSTDYVFDGLKQTPYVETDDANPRNVYGETKHAGEEAIRAAGIPHLIFRTSWVYSTRGKNFLLTILRLATEREELIIVNDQTGAPTCASDLAEGTVRVLTAVMDLAGMRAIWTGAELARAMGQVSGTYHMAASGLTSWYDFSRAILEEAAQISTMEPDSWLFAPTQGRPFRVRRIVPITTEEFRQEFPATAERPLHSALCNHKLLQTFGVQLSDWRTQLHRCFTVAADPTNAVSEQTRA
jgi:dTDP-4-dehydrorhamnose reductase